MSSRNNSEISEVHFNSELELSDVDFCAYELANVSNERRKGGKRPRSEISQENSEILREKKKKHQQEVRREQNRRKRQLYYRRQQKLLQGCYQLLREGKLNLPKDIIEDIKAINTEIAQLKSGNDNTSCINLKMFGTLENTQ